MCTGFPLIYFFKFVSDCVISYAIFELKSTRFDEKRLRIKQKYMRMYEKFQTKPFQNGNKKTQNSNSKPYYQVCIHFV